MDAKDLKRQLLELAREIGAEHVCGALVAAGVSPTTADRLSHGTHTAGFKRRTVAAVRAVLTARGKAAS
jgi:hypothetical protein